MDNQHEPPQSTKHTVKAQWRFYPKPIHITILAATAGLLIAIVLLYNLWYQNPSKVVSDAVLHAIKAKTVEYTGAVNIPTGQQVTITFDGKSTENEGSVNAVLTLNAPNDQQYRLEGNAVVDSENNLYFKVQHIDELVQNYRASIPPDAQDLFDRMIDKINNKWIKITPEQLENYSQDLSQTQTCTAEGLRQLQNSDDVKNEIINLYKQHPFITINDRLGSQNGSLGYELAANNDQLKQFTDGLKQTSIYKTLHDCDPSFTITDEDLLNNDAQTDDDNAASANVTLWVSRWAHHITKVTADTDTEQGTLNWIVEPEFNTNVTVDVPEDVTTLEKLQTEVQQLLRSAAPQPNVNERD